MTIVNELKIAFKEGLKGLSVDELWELRRNSGWGKEEEAAMIDNELESRGELDESE